MVRTQQKGGSWAVLLGGSSLLTWAYLLLGRGRFWRSGPVLLPAAPSDASVAVVLPARNEAEHVEATLHSLLRQEFDGDLRIVLVDDNSSDGTGVLAQGLAAQDGRLRVVQGRPLSAGWSGKLWAVQQGLEQPEVHAAQYVLLTDADILHAPGHIAALVSKAEQEQLELISEMVQLRTASLAERALVPAFVFFFQMLYPFALVNDPARPEAAAAGGTMLLAQRALERIGGVASLRGALIDDVALAAAVKRGGYPIWLGHAELARSQREYPQFRDVWQMIARTAYVQLRHSPLLLVGTCAGMGLLYAAPVWLLVRGRGLSRVLGGGTLFAMAAAFQPTLRRYGRSPLWGLALPAIALFYLAATVGSAVQHYRGRGGAWKGRTYPPPGSTLEAMP